MDEREMLIKDGLREVDEFGDLIPIDEEVFEHYLDPNSPKPIYYQRAIKDLSRKEWVKRC